MIAAHSTVPRWPAGPPDVDRTGRSFGLVGFGIPGTEVVRSWRSGLPATASELWTFTADGCSTGILRALAAQLDAATVGLRLMVAGPERDVLAARAVAFEAGLIDQEIRLHATSSTHRDVYCAHCHETTSVEAAVEEEATCGGCGRVLMVFAHLSARTGRYLGYQADSEELA